MRTVSRERRERQEETDEVKVRKELRQGGKGREARGKKESSLRVETVMKGNARRNG